MPGAGVRRATAVYLETLKYSQFTGQGVQYEALQTPTYYAATVPLRWVTENVLGIDDKLDATRATNVIWLITGLLLTWAAGRVMDVEVFALGAALLLLASAPAVVYGTSVVSNDATALPAGASVALAGALSRRWRRSRGWIPLFAVGFAAAALKSTNVLAVVAMSVALAVCTIRQRSGERWSVTIRRWLPRGGSLLCGGAVATAMWVITYRSRAISDLHAGPAFDALRATRHNLPVILREATKLLDPLTGTYFSPRTLDRDVLQPLY